LSSTTSDIVLDRPKLIELAGSIPGSCSWLIGFKLKWLNWLNLYGASYHKMFRCAVIIDDIVYVLIYWSLLIQSDTDCLIDRCASYSFIHCIDDIYVLIYWSIFILIAWWIDALGIHLYIAYMIYMYWYINYWSIFLLISW
jgi:hypothetical protein